MKAKLVTEEDAAYIEYRRMSKRGLIIAIILGNAIFFLTIAFGNILALFSPIWVIAFYFFSQLLVYLDYKNAKNVGKLKLIFSSSEVGIARITGDWSMDYKEVYPIAKVKSIIFRKSTFSLTFLVDDTPKNYNLDRSSLPILLIAELLEITANNSGIPCEVIP